MSRHIPRRVVLGALASVALAVALIVLGLTLVRPAVQAAAVANALTAADLDACDADPSTWGWASGALSFFAYDRSGRSANPAAPPAEAHLLRAALAEERVVDESDARRVVSWVPRAAAGPCAMVRVSAANAATVARPRFAGVLLAAALGGMLLAGAGALWFVVWPLRARVAALAAGARAVGEPSFAPLPGGPDALGDIAAVLTRSHTRVVEARAALEQRNRALEDHLAGIAHDLRTPLASMQLALEVLADAAPGDLRGEARRALADGVYLASLVENLHHGARLRQAFEVADGRVDLAELVHRLERRFAIIGRHADVAVAAHTPDHPVWVACRPALAERALANLVQNAVEHNPGPGHVALTLALVDDGARFALVVADDGPGLPEGARARLEAQTFVVDAARPRGPGLGVMITAEVARRAGWSITCARGEAGGTRVRLEGACVDGVARMASVGGCRRRTETGS